MAESQNAYQERCVDLQRMWITSRHRALLKLQICFLTTLTDGNWFSDQYLIKCLNFCSYLLVLFYLLVHRPSEMEKIHQVCTGHFGCLETKWFSIVSGARLQELVHKSGFIHSLSTARQLLFICWHFHIGCRANVSLRYCAPCKRNQFSVLAVIYPGFLRVISPMQ